MNEVKKFTKGNYVLYHDWYLDDFGLKKNTFEIVYKPTRTHYPFFGNLRVNNYNRSTPIDGDDTSPYTDKEYEEMLDEQVLKVSHL